MRLTFGKHKGLLIEHVPGSYLWFVLEECSNIDQSLRLAVLAELSSRLPSQEKQQAIDLQFLVGWCRRSALACHPDRGGAIEAMKLTNELRPVVDSAILKQGVQK